MGTNLKGRISLLLRHSTPLTQCPPLGKESSTIGKISHLHPAFFSFHYYFAQAGTTQTVQFSQIDEP